MKSVNKPIHFAALTFSMIFASGCASVAVNESSILDHTAATLGVSPSQLTISDRQDAGIKTSYKAKVTGGKIYNCYVTGMYSLVGRVVSDAMCSEPGRVGTVGTNSDNPLIREFNKGL